MNEQATRDLDRLRTDIYIIGYGTAALVCMATSVIVAVIGTVSDSGPLVAAISVVLLAVAAFWLWRGWQLGQEDDR